MRKGSRVVFVLSVLILVIGVGSVAYAASSYTINSNGVLRYDGNNDGDFTDSEDVVFDSNDLVNIGNEVNVLKTGLEGYESQLQTVASDVEQLRNDVDSVNESLGGLSFYEDEDGNKYVVGADSVPKKLSSGGKFYKLGQGTSFNITNIVGTENRGKYNSGNFLVVWSCPTGSISFSTGEYIKSGSGATLALVSNPTASYNASTGIVTVTKGVFKLTASTISSSTPTATSSIYVTPTVYFMDGAEMVSVQ